MAYKAVQFDYHMHLTPTDLSVMGNCLCNIPSGRLYFNMNSAYYQYGIYDKIVRSFLCKCNINRIGTRA